MRQWWLGLERRERRVLLAGGLAVLVTAFYVLAWSPLTEHVERLEQSQAQADELLTWTLQARASLQANRPTATGKSVPGSEVSPMLAIEQSAKAAGVLDSITRRRPDGSSGVQVAMDAVAFDRLPGWLSTLEQKYGLATRHLVVTRRDEPGVVDVRLQMERPQS